MTPDEIKKLRAKIQTFGKDATYLYAELWRDCKLLDEAEKTTKGVEGQCS